MNDDYGKEYPAALISDGVRYMLASETRWQRHYHTEDNQRGYVISRFMDGSAAITFPELERDWGSWTTRERHDFCNACSWLKEQEDFPEILRYVMQGGDFCDWSAVALPIAMHLPQDEAFGLLLTALQATELGVAAANISQGIAQTRHPKAKPTLLAHLEALWSHPGLREDNEFCNWIAFGATCAIKYLLELGAPPEDFAKQVRELSRHKCQRNRKSCHSFLAKYYPWLKDSSAGSETI